MSNRHVRSGRFAKKVTTAFRPNRGGGNQPGAPPQESDNAETIALKGPRKWQFCDPFRVHDSIRISWGGVRPHSRTHLPQAGIREPLRLNRGQNSPFSGHHSVRRNIVFRAHATGRRCAGLPALTKKKRKCRVGPAAGKPRRPTIDPTKGGPALSLVPPQSKLASGMRQLAGTKTKYRRAHAAPLARLTPQLYDLSALQSLPEGNQ